MFWEFYRIPAKDELESLDEIEAYYKNVDPSAYYDYIENLPINRPYAVTNKRKIAEEFMKTRDMKKFKVVEKDFDDEDIMELFESDPQLMTGARLDKFKIATAVPGTHTEFHRVYVVMTEMEHDAVVDLDNSTSIDILDFDWWYNTDHAKQLLSPYLFTKKYSKALNKLCMDTLSRHPGAEEPDPVLDELNIFIHLYSHLLK